MEVFPSVLTTYRVLAWYPQTKSLPQFLPWIGSLSEIRTEYGTDSSLWLTWYFLPSLPKLSWSRILANYGSSAIPVSNHFLGLSDPELASLFSNQRILNGTSAPVSLHDTTVLCLAWTQWLPRSLYSALLKTMSLGFFVLLTIFSGSSWKHDPMTTGFKNLMAS